MRKMKMYLLKSKATKSTHFLVLWRQMTKGVSVCFSAGCRRSRQSVCRFRCSMCVSWWKRELGSMFLVHCPRWRTVTPDCHGGDVCCYMWDVCIFTFWWFMHMNVRIPNKWISEFTGIGWISIMTLHISRGELEDLQIVYLESRHGWNHETSSSSGFTKVFLTVQLDKSWFFMEPSGNSEEVIHLHHLRAPHESVEIHRLVRKETTGRQKCSWWWNWWVVRRPLWGIDGSTGFHSALFLSQQSDGWMFVEE